jgi:hypothetical protein
MRAFAAPDRLATSPAFVLDAPPRSGISPSLSRETSGDGKEASDCDENCAVACVPQFDPFRVSIVTRPKSPLIQPLP